MYEKCTKWNLYALLIEHDWQVKYKNGEMEKLSLTELMVILVDQSIGETSARHRSATEEKEVCICFRFFRKLCHHDLNHHNVVI